MSRLILTIAMLGALGACAAAAYPADEAPQASVEGEELAGGPVEYEPAPAFEAPHHYAPPADVRCDIRSRRTANGVELEAVASSGAPASGAYEFVISKEDRGGSSDIVQTGEFALGPNEDGSLGVSEFSIGRGGSYSARLTVSDEAGVVCSEEVGS